MMESTNVERWGIAASAPPINPAEVETTEEAVEVVVMWGQNVLHVEHVSPPRDVILEDMLGQEAGAKHPVVVERDGRLCCVIPAGADMLVTVGDATRSLDALTEQGALASFEGLTDARLYPLPEGATAHVEHSGLTFVVRPTRAAKAVASGADVAWRRYGWVAISLAVHGIFLAAFYLMPPSTSALSLDNVSADARMIQYLDNANATEEVDEPDWVEPESTEEAGGQGERHDGEEGDSGEENAPQANNRYAVEGDPSDENPEMARERAREEMPTVGAIGAVAVMMGSWAVPTSPYGADQAHGNDAFSAIGNLMGDQAGSAFGNYGLGMSGTGRGAGGTGQGGIGLGGLDTLGHGGCAGGRCGNGNDYGGGNGRLHRRNPRPQVTVPRGVAQVRGGLSREAIRRVVRRNLSQVRHCYEQGLVSNPSIEGRVTVSWIVNPTGAVSTSSIASTTLSNSSVERCIARAVTRWSFPQPDGGGPVGVNYPFVLRSP